MVVALHVGHQGWPTKKIFGFQWSKMAKITLETISFGQNISIFKFSKKHLQIFSIFIYKENLPTKSYQFSKICKHFDKEREKILMQQSTKKEKLRKVELCFTTGCFIKSFNMINHFFCIASSLAAQFLLFDIRMTQVSKREVGSGK